MTFTIEKYDELRKSYWRRLEHPGKRKYFNGVAIIKVGYPDSDLLVIAPHSISHDEWNTGEYAWCLAHDLEVLSIIPLDFNPLAIDLDIKFLLELGGIRRRNIELDCNEMNILRLTHLFFKKYNLKTNLIKFSSNITVNKNEIVHLRIEIPQKFRRIRKNSFEFYKLLRELVKVFKNLKLPEMKCKCLADKRRNCTPLNTYLEKAFRISNLHGLNYYTLLKEAHRKNLLYYELLSEKEILTRHYDFADRLFKCKICGNRGYSQWFPVCDRCVNHFYLKSGTIEKALVLETDLTKLAEYNLRHVVPRPPPRKVENVAFEPELVEQTCLDCKSKFIIYKSNALKYYFCENCRAKYKWSVVTSKIYDNEFTMYDFISLPELREEFAFRE